MYVLHCDPSTKVFVTENRSSKMFLQCLVISNISIVPFLYLFNENKWRKFSFFSRINLLITPPPYGGFLKIKYL